MPLEVLLVNVNSMLNAGDAALTFETIRQLRDNFPGCHITLSSNTLELGLNDVKIVESINAWVRSPYKTGRISWNIGHLLQLPISTLFPILTYRLFGKPLYLFTPSRIRAAIQSHLDANLVINVPGGYIYTSKRGLRLVMLIYLLALVWLAGKPLYILPQSFGPLSHKWEGKMLTWVLQKARIVMVREPVSMELLQKYRFQHPRLYLFPDIAFAFRGVSPHVAKQWLREKGLDFTDDPPLIGLTIIDWRANNPNFLRQEEYELAFTSVIRYFLDKMNGRAIIFPQSIGPNISSDDRIPARRVVARLADKRGSILQIEQQISPDLIKSLYGCMDILIGTRMHSNIFALSSGVPVIAVGYLHKTRGIFSMIGMDRWVIDIQNITQQSLLEKFVELWEERMIVKAKIEAAIPSLVEKASSAGALCAADFNCLMENKLHGR